MTDTVDTLKQRVVGAFVIISLAVIFLPMVFDEPHQQESNVIVPVPERPSFQLKEIEKPVKPEYRRLEFSLDTQKVSIEEDVLVASSEESKADLDHKVADSNEAADQENIPSSKEDPIIQDRSSPQVNHLPIFKNVWMVQLGTFSQTENAYQLRDQLRKDGFDGHTKKIDLNGSTAIKVFTGPFVDKTQAEKIKIQLDKKYNLESRVIFFDA